MSEQAGHSQADRALDCADEMRIRASELRQMGFRDLAKHLNQQADAALKWATKQEYPS